MNIFDEAEAKIRERMTKTFDDITSKTKCALDELTGRATDILTKTTREKISEIESNVSKIHSRIMNVEETIKSQINDLQVSSASYISNKRAELTATINNLIDDESKKIEFKQQELFTFIQDVHKKVDDLKINANKQLEDLITEFNHNFEHYVDNNIDRILSVIINEKNVGKIIKAIVQALISKFFSRKNWFSYYETYSRNKR